MNLKVNTLSKKIGIGYTVTILILAIIVVLTIWQVREINATANRVMDLRMPSTRASLETLNNINQGLASLRGWILFSNPKFKEERQFAWNEIMNYFDKLEVLSTHWTNPANIERLKKLKPLIRELNNFQNHVEGISASDKEEAINLMENETVELTFQIKSLLNEMVEDQEALMREDFGNVDKQITKLNYMGWIFLAGGIVVSMIILSLTTRAITRPISNAIGVAQNIGSGNLESDVNVGGFKEVEVLGAALREMRDNLKKKTVETQLYSWLSSGQNKLNEVMRGDKDLRDLANEIVRFMAMYTDAKIGALYIMDDNKDKLSLTGKYAFSNGKVSESFKINEGLIGQVALNKRSIGLEGIDEKHIRVKSSIVDASPENVLVTPFLFEGETLGVVELGKFDEFENSHKEFIESSMEAIGIAFNSAIARQKIQELLEETRRQSEELQQQQEELEQTNEELEEQTQNLKQQQEELQAANEELEEQTKIVKEKNQDLERIRTEIERKAEQLEITGKYKSEFLANMSHELRTPLNSLLILSNDLAKNKEGNLDEEQVECMNIITKSGKTLLNLINEILDLSKIESGKMELDIKNVKLLELKENIYRNFRKTAEKKGLKLDVTIDEILPTFVQTDKLRLEQILKNLISNALKFTKKGGVKVSFERDAGDFLSMVVKDTGIGIPKDKHDLVFEAFKQAEGGTSREYGGTGLGLSISRELAKLLGGKIKLKSVVDEGSTFILSIPLRSSGLQNETISSISSEPNDVTINDTLELGDKKTINKPIIEDQRKEITENDNTILIIEDDPDFTRIISKQAKNKGFKFISASTGHAGLLLASEYNPSAIILDIGLPDIDGYKVLKELKNDKNLRHIPVHIISGQEKSLDPIKSGAMEYLTKPISKDQLDKAFQRIEEFIKRDMKNLLIVEDDKIMRRSIKKLIGNGDVQCYEASNAKEALKQIKSLPIDCMVLDIGLPDSNGFDLIKYVRKNNIKKKIPIVIYTGKDLSKKETEDLQQYAETIIVKGEKSEERLLDETALFLHRTVNNLPKEKRELISSLYEKEDVFKGKKLLLVDDDMRNVFALAKLLKEKGLEIIKADNGITALNELEKDPGIDIVLMDIMMPEMDGYQCMRKIREQFRFKQLPIIALTAKAMKGDRQKCIDAGANDYTTKPVEMEKLFSLMRIWLSR